MKTSNTKSSTAKPLQQRPATTPEGREQQIQVLAMDLAYERLRDGTASNQLICEVLKSASSERKLKREIMEEQKALLRAKTKAIQDQEQNSVDLKKVLDAFRTYSGSVVSEDDEDLY